MNTTALGPGGEFDAIRMLLARWGERAVGIGDDAAMLDVPRGEQLVVSVDSAVENEHFRREWLTPREIGYRAVTAALSDLAAMSAMHLHAAGYEGSWSATFRRPSRIRCGSAMTRNAVEGTALLNSSNDCGG